MSRQDRLYRLLLTLRDGRLHKGRDLARRFRVSLRTLYRDIETLQQSGVPVEGERGLGFAMTAPITLPPLNLTAEEFEALMRGLEGMTAGDESNLARAARALARKIEAVLPEDPTARGPGRGGPVFPFTGEARGFAHVATLRAAIRSRRKLRLTLVDTVADAPELFRPLQLEYWGRVWTLTGWSETADTFRTIRVDRIATLEATFESFEDEPGRRLSDRIDAGDA